MRKVLYLVVLIICVGCGAVVAKDGLNWQTTTGWGEGVDKAVSNNIHMASNELNKSIAETNLQLKRIADSLEILASPPKETSDGIPK